MERDDVCHNNNNSVFVVDVGPGPGPDPGPGPGLWCCYNHIIINDVVQILLFLSQIKTYLTKCFYKRSTPAGISLKETDQKLSSDPGLDQV